MKYFLINSTRALRATLLLVTVIRPDKQRSALSLDPVLLGREAGNPYLLNSIETKKTNFLLEHLALNKTDLRLGSFFIPFGVLRRSEKFVLLARLYSILSVCLSIVWIAYFLPGIPKVVGMLSILILFTVYYSKFICRKPIFASNLSKDLALLGKIRASSFAAYSKDEMVAIFPSQLGTIRKGLSIGFWPIFFVPWLIFGVLDLGIEFSGQSMVAIGLISIGIGLGFVNEIHRQKKRELIWILTKGRFSILSSIFPTPILDIDLKKLKSIKLEDKLIVKLKHKTHYFKVSKEVPESELSEMVCWVNKVSCPKTDTD